MTTAGIAALATGVAVLLSIIAAVVSVAWRVSGAMASLQVSIAKLEAKIDNVVSGPPQWCHQIRRMECPAREPTGVHHIGGA